ncbi:MAG: hypothetical protein PHS48_02360 [Bacteroidales bacterium]|nr:hypothetical protein [Bacteroidales bacterium]
MARKITILVLLISLSVSLIGQALPNVVDNSALFSPVRGQQVLNNCTHFSLIYYLKSYIWNRHYNRDPNLEENQFYHNFVWNQNGDPIQNYSSEDMAVVFMRRLGCGTIADMQQNEQSPDIFPSQEARDRALRYKSKSLQFVDIGDADSITNRRILDALRDSLNKGICFTMSFRVFDHLFDISKVNPEFDS